MANYYIATDGNDGNGGRSLDDPLATLGAAHALVQAGDTILMRGGTYALAEDETTRLTKDGTADDPIRLMAYGDEQPVIDGSGWTRDSRQALIIQTGDHWHVEGLEMTGAPFMPYIASGTNGSTFKDLDSHGNEYTGFAIIGESSDNLIQGGDFHDNFDPVGDGGNSDGIQISFGSGDGNVIDGVRAYNNSDDGIDLWEFEGNVTIRNSLAYGNGIDLWGHGADFIGDGNGFKLSGGEAAIRTEDLVHVVHDNVAWENGARGFDYNNSTGAMEVFNNTSYDNARIGFRFEGGTHVLTNNVSFDEPIDRRTAEGVESTRNSWDLSVAVAADDFLSLDDSGLTGARNADGSLPESDFLRLAAGSELIDAGADVGRGFEGAAPDLGAYESDGDGEPSVPTGPGTDPDAGGDPDTSGEDDGALTAYLIDAATDDVLGRITDGASISVGDADIFDLTVLVESDDTRVESIRLALDGAAQTESFVPYALFGDSAGGTVDGRDLNGGAITLGAHELALTSFDQDRGAGAALASETLSFTVRGTDDTVAPAPDPEVRLFSFDGDAPNGRLDIPFFDINSGGIEPTFDVLEIDVEGEIYRASTEAEMLELIRVAEAPEPSGMGASTRGDDLLFGFNEGGRIVLDGIASQLDQMALATALAGEDLFLG